MLSLILISCSSTSKLQEHEHREIKIDSIFSKFMTDSKDSTILRIHVKDSILYNNKILPFDFDYSKIKVANNYYYSDTTELYNIQNLEKDTKEIVEKKNDSLLYVTLSFNLLILILLFCQYGKLAFIKIKNFLCTIK